MANKLRALFLALAFGICWGSGPALADPPTLTCAAPSSQCPITSNVGSPVSIAAGPHTVYWIKIISGATQTAPAYPQLFNASSTPTLGTSVYLDGECGTPPAICFIPFVGGIYFPTGVWLGSATTLGGSSASASGTNVQIGYQ